MLGKLRQWFQGRGRNILLIGLLGLAVVIIAVVFLLRPQGAPPEAPDDFVIREEPLTNSVQVVTDSFWQGGAILAPSNIPQNTVNIPLAWWLQPAGNVPLTRDFYMPEVLGRSGASSSVEITAVRIRAASLQPVDVRFAINNVLMFDNTVSVTPEGSEFVLTDSARLASLLRGGLNTLGVQFTNRTVTVSGFSAAVEITYAFSVNQLIRVQIPTDTTWYLDQCVVRITSQSDTQGCPSAPTLEPVVLDPFRQVAVFDPRFQADARTLEIFRFAAGIGQEELRRQIFEQYYSRDYPIRLARVSAGLIVDPPAQLNLISRYFVSQSAGSAALQFEDSTAVEAVYLNGRRYTTFDNLAVNSGNNRFDILYRSTGLGVVPRLTMNETEQALVHIDGLWHDVRTVQVIFSPQVWAAPFPGTTWIWNANDDQSGEFFGGMWTRFTLPERALVVDAAFNGGSDDGILHIYVNDQRAYLSGNPRDEFRTTRRYPLSPEGFTPLDNVITFRYVNYGGPAAIMGLVEIVYYVPHD